jgi:hypothetical protein
MTWLSVCAFSDDSYKNAYIVFALTVSAAEGDAWTRDGTVQGSRYLQFYLDVDLIHFQLYSSDPRDHLAKTLDCRLQSGEACVLVMKKRGVDHVKIPVPIHS